MSSVSFYPGNVTGTLSHHVPGGGYDHSVMLHQSPAQRWLVPSTTPNIKTEHEERNENDSGISTAYALSEGRHSTSPDSTSSHDQNSHDSEIPVIRYPPSPHSSDPGNFFNSTPVKNPSPHYPNPIYPISHNFMPLTLPPMISPKIPSHASTSPNLPEIRTDRDSSNTTLPSTSPIHSESEESNPGKSEDPLQYLHRVVEGKLSEQFNNNNNVNPKRYDTEDENKSEYDCDDDDNIRNVQTNSHGKMKSFKCKQCDLIYYTKLEFWEHSRVHIKPEKLLTCTQCPFVTEYKHHLEYHLRNHTGDKPFKCDKCDYVCVNKSMLNSHYKSHSNVYQYRCANCPYVTKYMHSIKVHLRKFNHQPDTVLNPDGTPNPIPIIDVYGSRRGPKQRSIKTSQENNQNLAPSHFMMQNQNQSPPQIQMPMNFPFGPLLSALQNRFTHPLLFNNQIPEDKSELEESENNRNTPSPHSSSNCEDDRIISQGSSALDLTCRPDVDSMLSTQEPPTTPSRSKNRRKGRAFKLNHLELQMQHDESDVEEDRPAKVAKKDEEDKKEPAKVEDKPKVDVKPKEDENKNKFYCNHCEMSFSHLVMYTVHMGFHGYKDPFTCNSCGEETKNATEFFLHIARTPHH